LALGLRWKHKPRYCSRLSWLPSLLLGVVRAVGGGVIRDLAVGQRPTIFGGNTLYAICALLVSGLAVAGR
jgi:uncharacterized membrane protein YeiH